MFNNAYLIDDVPNTLYLHRYFLDAYDFTNNLLEFQDASEAINLILSDHSEDRNLIFLDLNMPIMSGWEFVDIISAELPPKQLETTTIVLVSSSCNPKDVSRAEAHPYIYAYIEKPFMPEDIESLFDRLNPVSVSLPKQVAKPLG